MQAHAGDEAACRTFCEYVAMMLLRMPQLLKELQASRP